MRPVSIIILAWNRWPLTRRLLDSIERFTDLSSVHVIVADNGSTDETAAELARYPWVRILRHERNLGFVRGNNAAIRLTGSDDVLLLNNDVEILHGDWLDRLQRTAYVDPLIGIVGCRLVLGDGLFLHAGTWIRPDDCWGQQIGSLEMDLDQYIEDREVEGIVFACAYLKRDVLESVGLLSESYESYFEDTDYCLRAAEMGRRTVCCGSVTMRHDEHGSTSDDDSFRRDLFARSREVFRRTWLEKLEARYSRSLEWQSILYRPTGYAVSSGEMLRALDNEGVRLTYCRAYEGWPSRIVEEDQRLSDHLLEIIRSRHPSPRPGIAVTYAQGDVFNRNRGRYKVGFTMLEVDAIPPEWVRQANDLDEVWTPTEFGRTTMIDSGILRPVHVIPLGVDPDHFHPGAKAIPNRAGDFVFAANFEWGERKAPGTLLKTFNATFRRSERAILVCKITNRDPTIDVPAEIRSLHLDESGGRIYPILNRGLPHYQLATFYRSAHCFVSTARGEGWGMPLHEAMACGLPAIATDWGGHTAILDPDDTYPLRIQGLVPASSACPYYQGFSWAEPDPSHLAQLFRHVYENREEARARGLRASARVRATLSWRKTARAIIERLTQIEA